METELADPQVHRTAVDEAALRAACRAILLAIGEDPDRAGLRDTPRRFAAWWGEFINYKAGTTDTVFEAVEADQMVVVSGLRVWSLCEHHLLPFWSDVSIAYIAGANVMGLSKLARIAHKHAHRLQLQERLVAGIADEVQHISGTDDVAVMASGLHLCMAMRGIRTPGTMTTSVMRGAFRSDASVRHEFLSLSGVRLPT